MPIQLSVSGAQLVAGVNHLVLHAHVRRVGAAYHLLIVIEDRIHRGGGRVRLVHRHRW